MTEDRLNGLALMFVHREMSAKPMDEGKIIDNVINRFCQKLIRRLPLC